jgi:hypothetical protein
MSHATRQLEPQVSATVRFFAAAAVCALLAVVCTVAEHASHEAVQTATAAFSGGPAPAASQVMQAAEHPAAPAEVLQAAEHPAPAPRS